MPKWTTKEWVELHLSEYDVATVKGKQKLVTACAKAIGRGRKTVHNVICEVMKEKGMTSEAIGRPRNSGCKIAPSAAVKEVLPDDSDLIDPADLLGRIDVVAQIKKYLDTVVKNKYIDSEKLRTKFGIGKDKWREVSSLPVFDGRTFTYTCSRTGRRVIVWSSKASITAAKETISMSRYDS